MFFKWLFSKSFFKRLLPLALPLAIRHLLISSLALVDTIMIGRIGEKVGSTAIASVDLANQVTFLFIVTMIGITGGGSVFTAQYWGNRDMKGVHRTLGLTLIVALVAGGLTSLFSFLFPEQILAFYTKDPQIIADGAQYLRIIAATFLMSGITMTYGATLQSIRHPKTPVIVSIIALTLNTLLNWILIFGHWGAPAMGIKGAAIATLISRTVEVTLLVAIIHISKSEAATTPQRLFNISSTFAKRVFLTSLPVILNQFLWAAGTTLYKKVYASLGNASLTAVAIAEKTIEMSMVVFFGTATATAVIIGNSLGENKMKQAEEDGKRVLILAPICGVILALILAIISPQIPQLFSVEETVATISRKVLLAFAITLPFKMYNMHMVDGVLRSGGDTTFGMMLDIIGVWFIGIPLAFVSAKIWGFPIELVYLVIATEEIVKATIGTIRVRSGKWINRLVSDDEKGKREDDIIDEVEFEPSL